MERNRSKLMLGRVMWVGAVLLGPVFLATWNFGQETNDTLCSVDPQYCGSLGVRDPVANAVGAWGQAACVVLFIAGLVVASAAKQAQRRERQAGTRANQAEHLELLVSASQRVLGRDDFKCRECGSTQAVFVFYGADPLTVMRLTKSELESDERMIALCEYHGGDRRRVVT